MTAGKTRSNTNENVLKLVNAKINTFEAREIEREEGNPPKFRKKKEIIWLSEYYEITRRTFIMEIINTNQANPIKEICVENETLKLKEYGKKRQYGPRQNWWKFGIQNLWNEVVKKKLEIIKNASKEIVKEEKSKIYEITVKIQENEDKKKLEMIKNAIEEIVKEEKSKISEITVKIQENEVNAWKYMLSEISKFFGIRLQGDVEIMAQISKQSSF